MKRDNAPIKALYTPFSEGMDRTCPLNEYPRPQMVRDNWTNLNGTWACEFSSGKEKPTRMARQILVPFSPEAPLSGVSRTLGSGETLWYERTFAIEQMRQGRLLLHFGAVDQRAAVYLNGTLCLTHEGGYFPFSVDITPHIKAGENTLTVAVNDDTQDSDEAYGKQTTRRGGIWYTAQSGIWQTVWMEWAPKNHITALHIVPHALKGEVVLDVKMSERLEAGQVCILAGDTVVAQGELKAGRICLAIEDAKLWSPDTPFLYDVKVTVGEDSVTSYFGMRDFGMTRGTHGRKLLTLNGKPIFHHGLLDQGYWSDGLYTPPSDEAMVWEISQMKRLGFNMLRKHIKIEPLRWYYHCDRLGMLVWQDFVCGGGAYSDMVVRYLPFVGVKIKDSHYSLFKRTSERGRANFLRDAERTVMLLRSVPSICCWVPFNEGWGQFDARLVADKVRSMDDTRYIDHASGYYDQGVGDFQSAHIYFKHYHPRRDRYDRVCALTEFGGYSLPLAGHMSSREEYGYKLFHDRDALNEALEELYRIDVIPALQVGLCAAVYTQVSDVEDEVNGLVTYDRRVVKVDEQMLLRVKADIDNEFTRVCRDIQARQ